MDGSHEILLCFVVLSRWRQDMENVPHNHIIGP